MSQVWVEGEIIHPDCQLKLATALSCGVRQCVLLLEDLRVTILKEKRRTSQLCIYGQLLPTEVMLLGEYTYPDRLSHLYIS